MKTLVHYRPFYQNIQDSYCLEPAPKITCGEVRK